MSKVNASSLSQIVSITEQLLRACNCNPEQTTSHRSPYLKGENNFPLPESALAIVNSIEFYTYFLAMEAEVKFESVANICGHLCFENPARFTLLTEVVLQRVANLEFDQFYFSLSVLLSVLKVKDSFQKLRIKETLPRLCLLFRDNMFFWKISDISIFCLLRACKSIAELQQWVKSNLHSDCCNWIESWCQRRPPKHSSEKQTMYKFDTAFSHYVKDPEEVLELKRKKGDNLTNFKKLFRSR